MILKIFIESHIKSKENLAGPSPSIHSEICQHEFFVSIIRLALYKFITLVKREMALLKKKGHQTSISKANASTPTPSQAVEKLYEKYLQPVIDSLTICTAMKEALRSEEVLLYFWKNLEPLSRLFCKYAECRFDPNSLDGSVNNGMLNIKQFTTFVTDTDFLGTSECNNKQYNVTLKDVRQIFSASQHDSMNEVEDQHTQQSGDNHQELMTFPEFIEAIARLGVIKFSNDEVDKAHFNSIRSAIEKIKKCAETIS
jgi:hypothetical protein